MAEYIEREAAEKILYDGCHTSNGRECPDDVVELWHMIQALPAADVVPVRHGRWVKKHDNVCYWYECSECGEKPPKDQWKNQWLSSFCPNCGANMMDGGEK